MKTFRVIGIFIISILLGWACSEKEEEAEILCSIEEIDFMQDAGVQVLNFTANKMWNITKLEEAEWCTLSQATGKAGAASVSVKVTENTDYDGRSVTLVIACEDANHYVKITQQQKNALLLTTEKEISVSYKGDTIDVGIKSNVDVSVHIPEDAKNWISENASGRGLTDRTIRLIVAENKTESVRSSEITFSDEEGVINERIIVTQDRYTPYVTFIAEAEQSLMLSQPVETLEYSVNDGEWMELGTTTVSFGGNLGSLRLRGKSVTGTAISLFNYSQIVFGNESPVLCSGDIRTLVDYENYATCNTSEAKFFSLFKDCSALVSAPQLPAMDLASCCYENMFTGCSSLTVAPELPATKLADSCYEGMFSYCTSLKEPPSLPAMNVNYCSYSFMFYGCTNLASAPELLATTVGDMGYSHMFVNCTSLTSSPELPATEIGRSCYNAMFFGCTNLVSSPSILPAMELTEYCYALMFDGCTSLKTAPELPATALTIYCYNGMFSNCKSLTTAPEIPAQTVAEKCCLGMFDMCDNLVKAPTVLPALTLADYCYCNMFLGCVNLTAAPELPATTMAKRCYDSMFLSTALTEAPDLPALVLADSCYRYMLANTDIVVPPALPATELAEGCYHIMFSSCENLISAPELPAVILAKNCYDGMFSDCISLTSTPVLAAPILVDNCYEEMFIGCVGLQNVTMLATDISAADCLKDWMQRVHSSGVFVKATTMDELPEGASGIPNDWTVKNYGEE